MARDIEEFLRRAAERRKQQQNQRQPAPVPSQRIRQIVEKADIEVVADEVEIVKPRRQLVERPTPKVRRELRDQGVGEHVQQHINTRSISEHADRLGDDIQQADDRIAKKLRRKFDHDVSKLDDLPTVQDDIVAVATEADISHLARDLIEMISSPNGVRQAILISEILKRPDFD